MSSVCTGRSSSLICNAKDMPQGGSRRIVVIGTYFQICSWIRLGLLYLWQGFPGQKYEPPRWPTYELEVHPNLSMSDVLCMCCAAVHTVSQMDPVHTAFALSSAQSINYRGNQANDTCTQCGISACFWTSYILRFIMEVKRGHGWDNQDTWGMFFLSYDLPKRWFFRSCKVPVVHLWTGTQYCMSKTNAFFYPLKESV